MYIVKSRITSSKNLSYLGTILYKKLSACRAFSTFLQSIKKKVVVLNHLKKAKVHEHFLTFHFSITYLFFPKCDYYFVQCHKQPSGNQCAFYACHHLLKAASQASYWFKPKVRYLGTFPFSYNSEIAAMLIF